MKNFSFYFSITFTFRDADFYFKFFFNLKQFRLFSSKRLHEKVKHQACPTFNDLKILTIKFITKTYILWQFGLEKMKTNVQHTQCMNKKDTNASVMYSNRKQNQTDTSEVLNWQHVFFFRSILTPPSFDNFFFSFFLLFSKKKSCVSVCVCAWTGI